MKTAVLSLSLFFIASVSACRTTSVTNTPLQAQRTTITQQTTQQNVSPSSVVDSRFEYKNGKTELNIIIERGSGEEFTLKSTNSPGSSSVDVQTTVRSGGQVTSRYSTSPSEAQLAVKLAANNGWRDVYNDLKARYELAGLL